MASSKRKARAEESSSAARSPEELAEYVATVCVAALEFTSKDRAEATLRQWHAGAAGPPDETAMAYQIVMMMDLSLFAPSPSGMTALDRLAKAGRQTDPSAILALDIMRHARLRIVRIEAIESEEIVRLQDVATGETVRLRSEEIEPASIGRMASMRLGVYPDGLSYPVGPMLPLDEAALSVAMAFVRPNFRGLVNAQRCAEAVYRHVARNGCEAVGGLNDMLDRADDAGHDALAELVQARAELPAGAAPPPSLVNELRMLADIDHVIVALDEATGGGRLAASYSWAASVLIETMHRRALVRPSLPGLAEIRAALRASGAPPEVCTLFDQLARPLGDGVASGRPDGELDRLMQRIRHLRARTVEQGCTEAEALAAAEKVAELLDRHGLSLSDVDYRRQTCDSIAVETARRRAAPIDDCLPTIAAFFDCRVWWEIDVDGARRFTLFGLAGDVQGAHYLWDLIGAAFASEGRTFADSDIYRSLAGGMRRRATVSFQHGLAHGIVEKLQVIKRRRDEMLRKSSGRDLVPIKTALVDDEVAKLGLRFTSKAKSSGRRVMTSAFEAGTEAGERFEYAPAIGGA